jgi:Domain of unknown function (DUF1841)
MFNPSREEARRFLIDAWAKFRAGDPLSDLERIATGLIVQHPEYHALLERPDTALERDYAPESGSANPFLHLNLHLAIAEQLAIDQPRGIRSEYERLVGARGNEHDALHAVLECLGEVIWQAQRTSSAPDAELYLACLRRQE